MVRGSVDGPAWLGIGAQRAGTTWFADLLVQHPEMSYGRSERKELHRLEASLFQDRVSIMADYLAEFRGLHGAPGEFTPAYLRTLWAPELARALCRPDVVLVVILRDPVDRFASAMRLFRAQEQLKRTRVLRRQPKRDGVRPGWARDKGVDATWAGMYATQLAAWTQVFAPDQLVVLQYEAVTEDPQAAAQSVWTALGLGPHELERIGVPSRTTVTGSQWSFDQVPGLRERLVEVYRPEVARLESVWGIDSSRWSNFT